MDTSQVDEQLKAIFLDVFQAELSDSTFDWEKQQNDYENWDSFAQLNLITLTEAKFDISFSLNEATEIKSANELFESIKSHLT